MKRILIILTIILMAVVLTSCAAKQTATAPTDTTPKDNQVTPTTPGDGSASGTTGTGATTGGTVSANIDTSKGFEDKNGCYDSEGGKFYEKKGYIIDAKEERYEDVCASPSSLTEYYCGIIGYKTQESYGCPYGCSDGACITEANNPNKCVETDKVKEYTAKGSVTYQSTTSTDYCRTDKYLVEHFCTTIGLPSSEEKYCQDGCVDGACVVAVDTSASSCVDSDFGSKPEFTKGTVTDPNGVIEDSCMNSRTVKEWKCNTIGYRTSTNIECVNGCLDGVCKQ